MPHVVTQSCCSDGSCVYACPVNCIHPTPDEPGFATAEMLHIDPAACVDCGTCVPACPVGAIAPENKLVPEHVPFVAINASFFPRLPSGEHRPLPSTLAPAIEAPKIHRRDAGPLRVAIVGSGPAAMYSADELLTQRDVHVNVFERLPTPYGLVRAGVAPDHQPTKRITTLFDRMARQRGFQFYLNVEVGRHLSHAELLAHHHAVLYAVGASSPRRLEVPGFGIPGTSTATEVALWLNAHPDHADRVVPLDHERVVIIGNGNVALDVARMLAVDPDEVAATDISMAALAALRGSRVREVVVAARRGPAQSAFTLPELIGLTGTCRVVLSAEDHERVRADLADCADASTRHTLALLSSLDVHREREESRVIRLAYCLTPSRVLGDKRAAAVELTDTGTHRSHQLAAGLVLSAIGHRGRPVPDLPFDDAIGLVPSRAGRVIDPHTRSPLVGAYVAGWIKRGSRGFIGTNKTCAHETVTALVDDYNEGRLARPVGDPATLDVLVRERQPRRIDLDGWRAIDSAEIARGVAHGRPREKFASVTSLIDASANSLTARARRFLTMLSGH